MSCGWERRTQRFTGLHVLFPQRHYGNQSLFCPSKRFFWRDCNACYPWTSLKLKTRNRFVRARAYYNIMLSRRVCGFLYTYICISVRRGGREDAAAKWGEIKKRKTLWRRRATSAVEPVLPSPSGVGNARKLIAIHSKYRRETYTHAHCRNAFVNRN